MSASNAGVCADVSALVLSLGEPSLPRALASLGRQTRPPRRIVRIEGVSGFDIAFNLGVSQVETEYFVQCDADMILDPDCIEVLRGSITAAAGICAGRLRDPLLGDTMGVKLFRTRAARELPLPATLTPETDGIGRFAAAGYGVTFAARAEPAHGRALDVLGAHEPAYDDPRYVWSRFYRLGCKVRKRRGFRQFERYLASLRTAAHPNAGLAIVALCQGIAAGAPPGRHEPTAGGDALERYLEFSRTEKPPATSTPAAGSSRSGSYD